jgi:hypothetical protein
MEVIMKISSVRVRSSVTLLGLVVLSTAAAAQGVTGTVKGKDNDPKQFVTVSLDGGRYTAITDEHGAFTVQNVPPGRSRVSVRQGGKVEEFTRDVGSAPLDLTVKW